MTPTLTMAVAARVLRQLRRDPRTIALLLVMPVLLLTLLRYVFDGAPHVFQSVGPTLAGILPLTLMFVVTSVTMLRERSSGTLERLMAMPIGKADLVVGYGLAFGIVAALQGAVTSAVVLGPLGVEIAGSAALLLVFSIGNGLVGCALGLLASAFARTEFQAVQFMPATVFPQLLLCGLLVPREQMAGVLEAASYVMPMTWGVDGLQRVAAGESLGARGVVVDLIVIAGIVIAALAAGAATLRRRTA